MKSLWREALVTATIFVLLVLGFTLVSLLVAPGPSKIGSARPLATIPLHEVELGGVALVLGALALGVYGRGGAAVSVLLPSLVILLDLDHLPSFLGIAQPIRPAHSLVFLVLDVLITTIILRRLDFGLVAVSAFTAHLGVDSGLAPPLSPFSFQYVQLDPYHVPLLLTSAAFAVAAGYLMRKGGKT